MIDPAILAEIWRTHVDRLLLIARSIGGPAEDAVQEAFVELAARQELPDDSMAWLVKVTRNRLLQWHRGNRRRRNRESLVGHQTWFDGGVRSSDRRLDGEEVASAIQAMPSPDREIIVMHIWGEMSFESIARVVGGSRAKAHRTFRRQMQNLKEQFDPDHLVDAAPGSGNQYRGI